MDWCENKAEIESLVKVKVTCYCNQPEKDYFSQEKQEKPYK